MNTIEALQYLKDEPNTTLVTHDDRGYRIEMSIDKQLWNFDGSLFVKLIRVADGGEKLEVHFEEWVELGNEWEVSKEVMYYVKFKALDDLEVLLNGEKYLNYGYDKYFISSIDELAGYKTKFTRDEIEEFGIEHPEVRREDLEFIEVVE